MKMYDDLAAWWPLMSAPEDYEEEAGFYYRTLAAACAQPPRTVLELGSGGGNNASHMKAHVSMVLVEPSDDMRTIRLGREFDAVFVHDAVCYMTTEADLRLAIETAFLHCRPGGAALFAPDYVAENFKPGTDHGGHDSADGRAVRYLEWTWDPDPQDTTYLVDYAFLLR